MAYVNSPDGSMFDGHASWQEGTKIFNVANVLHGYNISILLGVIFCFLGIIYFWRRMKYSWAILEIMLMIAIPTGIFGARFWTCIWDGGWDQFFNFAGLSIQGGVLAGMICVSPYVWYVRRQVDFRTVYGIVIPNILIAQGIGRFGNFFNHELYGSIVPGNSLNWMGAMKQHMLIEGMDGTIGYRAPMFLYESITSFGGWFILVPFLLRKNWLRPGVTGALYWVWYGVWRAVFEPMKDQPWVHGSFQVATFISALSIVVGSLLAIYWQWLCRPLKLFAFKKSWTKKCFGWMNFVIKQLNKMKFLHFPRDFEKITPVKPRRKYELFGPKQDTKKQYFFFGKEVPNEVIIWLPITPEERRWSKRELNRGSKFEK